MCALSLPILPGGERLSSSLDGKVREMTDYYYFCFFFIPSANNGLCLGSPVSPISSLHGEDSGVKQGVGGEGKEA